MSTKNKHRDGGTVAKQTLGATQPAKSERTDANAPEAGSEGTSIGDDLESAPEGNLTKHVVDENTPQFGSLEWLMAHNPLDFINDLTASSKYDKEREGKIHDGIAIIRTIKIAETEINPLLLLLASWWEVKPARTEIKKLIDAEATAKGFAADVYMQIELGKHVDALAEMQSAIDRIRYAKTYFKPRNRELSTAVITKPLMIDGEIYEVPVIELEKAKITFKDANDGNRAMKDHLITLSTKRTVEIEEL